MLEDLLNGPAAPSQGQTRQVKTWVKHHLGLADEITVMVSELHCGEKDCADTETVIAILGGDRDGQKKTIDKAIASLSEADIARLWPLPGAV